METQSLESGFWTVQTRATRVRRRWDAVLTAKTAAPGCVWWLPLVSLNRQKDERNAG